MKSEELKNQEYKYGFTTEIENFGFPDIAISNIAKRCWTLAIFFLWGGLFAGINIILSKFSELFKEKKRKDILNNLCMILMGLEKHKLSL